MLECKHVGLYICVCMNVCTYIRTYVRVLVCLIHVGLHIRVCLYVWAGSLEKHLWSICEASTCAFLSAFIHAIAYIDANLSSYTDIWIKCMCVWVRAYVRIYVRVLVCLHVLKQAHILMRMFWVDSYIDIWMKSFVYRCMYWNHPCMHACIEIICVWMHVSIPTCCCRMYHVACCYHVSCCSLLSYEYWCLHDIYLVACCYHMYIFFACCYHKNLAACCHHIYPVACCYDIYLAACCYHTYILLPVAIIRIVLLVAMIYILLLVAIICIMLLVAIIYIRIDCYHMYPDLPVYVSVQDSFDIISFDLSWVSLDL